MSDLIGKRLGSYRLTGQLGTGGFAVVYLGEHVHLKTLAAIKVLHKVQLSSDEEEKFRKEARTIAELKHPNIIGVLDYGVQESSSIPYLVMEYAPKTVRQHYPTGSMLLPLDILPYLRQIASGLQHAHDHKVIHRDVKPENMLLDENGVVRLSDFGIAVVLETSRALNTLDKFGTPPYMAPEQFQGEPVPASDQYSLGIVVYEWLCGTRPFTGSPAGLMHQHLYVTPPSMRERSPSLSPALEEIILKALAKKPRERYASIWEFAQAFERACQVKQAGNDTHPSNLVSAPSSRSRPSISAPGGRPRPGVATPPEDSTVVWNVPYRQNPFFTGRTQVLTRLHDAFNSKKMAIKTQALSGLGGIGKTQIAIEYVYRYYNEYRVILWVRGDTREQLLSEFADLTITLRLKERREQERGRAIEAVGSWLRKNASWLLIIDNTEDLELLDKLLPSAGRGHILLTTRTQTTGYIAQCIGLGKMTLEENTLFLLKRAKIVPQDAGIEDASTADREMAQAIAQVFDGLPLALDQAGAYIDETGCGLSNYLCRYRAGRRKLLDMRGSFDFDHPASVKETFSSPIEIVGKISPPAVELLNLCAFLQPDAIPEALIINGAAELGPTLEPLVIDPILLDEALGFLRKFSLVRRHSDTNTLSVHCLVQAVIQDSMSEETQRLWVERTVRVVNQVLPDIDEFIRWPLCKQYMPHVHNCVALIEKWKIVSLEAARLLEQAGRYLQVQARFTQATDLFERAANMRTLLVDTGSAVTAAALTRQFWHYYCQGQYAQAGEPIEQALKLLQMMPDPDQQLLAACLSTSGHLACQQGKYSQAEDYFLQALTIYEQDAGLQHPSVVCTFSGLGTVSLALAKYDQAEKFFSDALSIWHEMPEPQHPLMGSSLNDIARLAMARGNYALAKLSLQQERTHLEQTLQPQHPALASNLNDQALLSIALGKYSQAEPLLKQAQEILEQSVGLQHPIAGHLFDALGSLAFLQKNFSAAAKFFQRAQRILEQAAGSAHPDVLATVIHLADAYRETNKLSLAEALYHDVLLVRSRVLGERHPAVAQTLHSLAQLYHYRSQYTQEEELLLKALTIRQEALGKEHPDVARTLYSLAYIYHRKWKQHERAEPLLKLALVLYEKAQIAEHPEVVPILRTYASLLIELKRYAEAKEIHSRLKTIRANQAD